MQLQADLMDVSLHAPLNDNVKSLLTAVVTFSRHAWALPLKNKSAVEVAGALRRTFLDSGYRLLQTDKGTEFRNARVNEFLRDAGTRWFSSENETIKASLVERFNRTLRRKIHSYLTFKRGTGRYLDVLPDLVRAYNDTPHSAIGMTPNEVNSDNAYDVYLRLYEHPMQSSERALVRQAPRLKAGDHVRITNYRGAFARGYTEQWSREIFVVTEARDWEQPVVYTIKDLADEPIEGTFYEAELQRVAPPTEYLVERVVRTRGRGGYRQHLVKWLGYPESMNSWVDDADFDV
jgi:hypothetical protein